MDKKTLWAPWRIGYIKSVKKSKGCLFCKCSVSKNDSSNLVIFKSKHSLAMLNLYPYNNGHLMVSPRKHVKSLELLSQKETLDLINTLHRAKKRLQKILRPQGFNIGMNIGKISGAGIDQHLHIHIVPRWQGDTNFMPALCATKVISQSLEELRQILSETTP